VLLAVSTGTRADGNSTKERVWTFDDQPVGAVPADWRIRQTRPTQALASWSIMKDPTAPSKPNVMALTHTKNDDPTFNLAIAKDTSFKDVDLSVNVKAISGETDQGGGPIWRCQDENNYYVTRFNPLESNFRVYYVHNGRRKQLQSARIDTVPGTWYSVRVTMIGHHITAYLDGKKLLEATDDTFSNAGMVGLWTKSDAVTRFDDLSVEGPGKENASLLNLKQTIPLPGVKGRIDHLTLDPTGNRLFVAALGNGTVEVIDLTSGRRIHSITGLDEPQGIVYLPDSKRVVVACGGDGTVRSFDTKTWKEVAHHDLGDDADNIRWEASRNLIHVGFGDGALGVLEAETLKKRQVIKLPGHPESFQLDRSTGRTYVNVPDARQIAVINRNSDAVATSWSIPKIAGNYPMALDETGKRLFVACRQPPRLLVFDTRTGHRVTSTLCVGDADDIFYDGKRNRIYIVGGEGFVDVFSGSGGSSYPRLAQVRTSPGARTALFVPARGLMYVALPAQEEQDAEVRIFQVSR